MNSFHFKKLHSHLRVFNPLTKMYLYLLLFYLLELVVRQSLKPADVMDADTFAYQTSLGYKKVYLVCCWLHQLFEAVILTITLCILLFCQVWLYTLSYLYNLKLYFYYSLIINLCLVNSKQALFNLLHLIIWNAFYISGTRSSCNFQGLMPLN